MREAGNATLGPANGARLQPGSALNMQPAKCAMLRCSIPYQPVPPLLVPVLIQLINSRFDRIVHLSHRSTRLGGQKARALAHLLSLGCPVERHARKKAAVASGPKFREETPKKGSSAKKLLAALIHAI